MFRFVALALSLTLGLALPGLAPAPAHAAQLEPAARLASSDYDGAAFALARADQIIELVRATREIEVASYPGARFESDLRVALVVLDLGPSTDVSPRLELQLSMLNTIGEYGTAWALEPVASVYKFDGVERTAPGIYEARAVVLTGGENPGCYFQNAVIRIDARDLSVAVRRARGLQEFDAQRYATDMPVTVQALGCADSPY